MGEVTRLCYRRRLPRGEQRNVPIVFSNVKRPPVSRSGITLALI
jgi:hypothetical protein